jgi:methylmalonyl-CoA/ethylmalonyl-CoA epimerase
MKIEHLGIAVKSIKEAELLYESLFSEPAYKREAVVSEAVTTSFFQVGESKIELLESTSPDGVIAKYIEKHGEGLHHIAFEVMDIYHEIERLKNLGFRFVSETPKTGADNKLVCFLHPKSTSGVLIELCQDLGTNSQSNKEME